MDSDLEGKKGLGELLIVSNHFLQIQERTIPISRKSSKDGRQR